MYATAVVNLLVWFVDEAFDCLTIFAHGIWFHSTWISASCMSPSLETLRILDQLGAFEFEKTSGNDQNLKGETSVLPKTLWRDRTQESLTHCNELKCLYPNFVPRSWWPSPIVGSCMVNLPWGLVPTLYSCPLELPLQLCTPATAEHGFVTIL